jgi:hypothetical protein
MLSAGDDAWSKSGSHYSYTRTGKISPESLPDGSIKYTFSLGCPEYPFDAGTGSCTPGDLEYSGGATSGSASGVTGTVDILVPKQARTACGCGTGKNGVKMLLRNGNSEGAIKFYA